MKPQVGVGCRKTISRKKMLRNALLYAGHSFISERMFSLDMLYKCAKSYENLLSIQYKFTIGKKGKLKEFILEFNKDEFIHLIGLHKTGNIYVMETNKNKIFDSILNNKLTISNFKNAPNFHIVKERLDYFIYLEQILDNNETIFRWNESRNKYSIINAKFLLKNNFINRDIYIFLDENVKTGMFYCRSFFPKDDRDYTLEQPRFTLLKKEKINIVTKSTTILYDKLTPINTLQNVEDISILEESDFEMKL